MVGLGDCYQAGQGKGPAAALPAEAYRRFSFNALAAVVIDKAGTAWRGRAWQAWSGEAWRGMARQARQGRSGQNNPGRQGPTG